MEEETIKEEILKILYEKTGGQYSEKVIDYGTAPRNNGTMSDPDGYAKYTGPCGDTVEIFLRVKNGKIEDIRYMTDGCMTSHAAVSAATEMAKGKSPRDCLKISQSAILDHLGGMPQSNEHCALLASITLHKALRNYAVGKKHSG
jgi:nitrogen fixation NifU-like protein